MMKKRKTAGSVQQLESTFENYPGGNLHTENNIYGQQLVTLQGTNTGKSKDKINYQLMHRLASGTKAKLDTKEMKRLTKKNFQELPENKKKRDEEKKKAEALERNAKINQYKKELDERRKLNFKKKSMKQSVTQNDEETQLQPINEESYTGRMTDKQKEMMKMNVIEAYKVMKKR